MADTEVKSGESSMVTASTVKHVKDPSTKGDNTEDEPRESCDPKESETVGSEITDKSSKTNPQAAEPNKLLRLDDPSKTPELVAEGYNQGRQPQTLHCDKDGNITEVSSTEKCEQVIESVCNEQSNVVVGPNSEEPCTGTSETSSGSPDSSEGNVGNCEEVKDKDKASSSSEAHKSVDRQGDTDTMVSCQATDTQDSKIEPNENQEKETESHKDKTQSPKCETEMDDSKEGNKVVDDKDKRMGDDGNQSQKEHFPHLESAKINMKITKIPSVVVTNEYNDIIEEVSESQHDMSQAVRRHLKTKILEKRERKDVTMATASTEPKKFGSGGSVTELTQIKNQSEDSEKDKKSAKQTVSEEVPKPSNEQINSETDKEEGDKTESPELQQGRVVDMEGTDVARRDGPGRVVDGLGRVVDMEGTDVVARRAGLGRVVDMEGTDVVARRAEEGQSSVKPGAENAEICKKGQDSGGVCAGEEAVKDAGTSGQSTVDCLPAENDQSSQGHDSKSETKRSESKSDVVGDMEQLKDDSCKKTESKMESVLNVSVESAVKLASSTNESNKDMASEASLSESSNKLESVTERIHTNPPAEELQGNADPEADVETESSKENDAEKDLQTEKEESSNSKSDGSHDGNSDVGKAGSELNKNREKDEAQKPKSDKGTSDCDRGVLEKEEEEPEEDESTVDYSQFNLTQPPKTTSVPQISTPSNQYTGLTPSVSVAPGVWQGMAPAYATLPQNRPVMINMNIHQMSTHPQGPSTLPYPGMTHSGVIQGGPISQQVSLADPRNIQRPSGPATLAPMTRPYLPNPSVMPQRIVQVQQPQQHLVPAFASPHFQFVPISQSSMSFSPISSANVTSRAPQVVGGQQVMPPSGMIQQQQQLQPFVTLTSAVSSAPITTVSMVTSYSAPVVQAQHSVDNSEQRENSSTTIPPEDDDSQLLNQFSFYRCDRCAFQTRLRQNFRRHYALHLNYKPYSCNSCSYKSYYKYGMPSHVSLHEKEAQKGYQYYPDPALDKTIEFFCDKCKEVHWVDKEAYSKLCKEILGAQKRYRHAGRGDNSDGSGRSSGTMGGNVESKEGQSQSGMEIKTKLSYTGHKRGPRKKTEEKLNAGGDVTSKHITKRPYRKSSDRNLDTEATWQAGKEMEGSSGTKKRKVLLGKNKTSEEDSSHGQDKATCAKKKKGSFKKQQGDNKAVGLRKVKKTWKFGMRRMKVRRRLALAQKRGNMPNYEIVDESNILSTPKRVRKFKTTFDPSPEVHVSRKPSLFIPGFKKQSSVKLSSKNQESKIVRKAKCPYCSYYSDTVIGVRRHAFWTHNMCQYHCARCTFSSLSKREVLDHNKERHSGQSPCISRSLSKVMANGESFESILEETFVTEDNIPDKGTEAHPKSSGNKLKSEPMGSKSKSQEKQWRRSVFKCTECGYKSSYVGLQRHMMLTHKICQYQCGYCDFLSDDREATVSHSISNHKGVAPNVIRSYVNLNIPQENVAIEAKIQDKKSLVNKKPVKDNKVKYKLLQKYRQKVTDMVTCPLCDFESQYRGVQRHLLMLHKVCKWQCGYCNLKTVDKAKAMEHCLSEHEGKSPCVLRTFVNLDHLMEIVHHKNFDIPGMTKDPRAVSGCPSRGTKKSNYSPSESRTEEREDTTKDTACPECDFKSNVRGVQRHMLVVHKICKWQCKHCGFESIDRRVTLEHSKDMHTDTNTQIVRAFVDLDKYRIVKKMNESHDVQSKLLERESRGEDVRSRESYSEAGPHRGAKRRLISLTPSLTDDEDDDWDDDYEQLHLGSLGKRKKFLEGSNGRRTLNFSSSKSTESENLRKNRFRSSSPLRDVLSSAIDCQTSSSGSDILHHGKKRRGRPKSLLNIVKSGSNPAESSSSFVLRPKDLYRLNQGFSCVYCVYAAPLRHQVRLHCYDKHTNHPACLMEFKIDSDANRGDTVEECAPESPEPSEGVETNVKCYMKTESQSAENQEVMKEEGGVKSEKNYRSAEDTDPNQDVKQSNDGQKADQSKCAIDCKTELKRERGGESEIQCEKYGRGVQKGSVPDSQNSPESDIDELQVSEIIENGNQFNRRRKRKLRFRNPLQRLVKQLKSGRIDLKDTFHGSLDDVDSFLHKFGVRTLNMDMLTHQQFSIFIKKFGSNLEPM